MTVIAWDGLTLAADKQSTIYGHGHKVTKVHRVPQGLIAFQGSGAHAYQLLGWFQGKTPDFPKPVDADNVAHALLITHDSEIRAYSGHTNGSFEIIESKFFACGAGRDYALAAMHLGYSAEVAVKVACELDVNCGLGIDTLTLKE